MTAFIDGLMAKMTIQENIEQFNLLSASTITTGAKKESPMLDLITQGKLGAILNMKGFEDVCTLQGDGRRAEPSRDSIAHGPRRHPRPQDRGISHIRSSFSSSYPMRQALRPKQARS